MDRGFHEITLVDMGDTSGPYVFIADLSLLWLQWPIPVVSSLSGLQPELTDAKKPYRRSQADGCSYCGKRIKLDMARHVANYHLELSQRWRCPVSWCTVWNRTPQDCMGHLHLAHTIPASVRTANLGKWFPPWTVTRQTWKDALNPRNLGVFVSECGHTLVHHYRVLYLRREYPMSHCEGAILKAGEPVPGQSH